MKTEWPEVWKVRLGPELEISLPLTNLWGGFYIYSFDMTGEAEWNRVAAKSLTQKLAKYDFYSFVTVQTKSSGLTQAISGSVRSYLELRKSHKGFMREPKHITVRSITTEEDQELWIGREKYEEFVGKSSAIDDVVSTGGTVDSCWRWRRRWLRGIRHSLRADGGREENGIQGHPAGFARPYPSSRGHRLRLGNRAKMKCRDIRNMGSRHLRT